jgi:transcription elongation factor Elf1
MAIMSEKESMLRDLEALLIKVGNLYDNIKRMEKALDNAPTGPYCCRFCNSMSVTATTLKGSKKFKSKCECASCGTIWYIKEGTAI